jgi:hypothetical protein
MPTLWDAIPSYISDACKENWQKVLRWREYLTHTDLLVKMVEKYIKMCMYISSDMRFIFCTDPFGITRPGGSYEAGTYGGGRTLSAVGWQVRRTVTSTGLSLLVNTFGKP